MKTNYKTTMLACFVGYIVQAIVNNFVPLLFVTFAERYCLPLSKITFIITINFIIQLIVDALSPFFIQRIGCRISMVLAHIMAAGGLVLLTFVPDLFGYGGIMLCVLIYAVGGGLLEVLVSPLLEACPTDNKEKAMSLLHSFYCWGHVGVVLISTLFFSVFGISFWKALTLLLSLIPLANAIVFTKTAVYSLPEDEEKGFNIKTLCSQKLFWIFMLMMICAGASEQSVSQWASAFAEKGLQIGKTVGDLAGAMSFAALMGSARLIYGKYGDKINLDRFMKFSCTLCILSYLFISLVPVPLISLLSCAVCGFSVGIMWPGTFSKAQSSLHGGTLMFALLALAGDIGCSVGPTLAGFVSGLYGENLRMGILSAAVFPILLLICLFFKSEQR